MRVQSRVSRVTSFRVNAMKSAAYTAALWLVCLFGLPAAIYAVEPRLGLTGTRFEPGSFRFVAIALFMIAALIGFRSAAFLIRLGEGTPMPLACTRRLVIAGPYRYIRNPMSTMGIVQGLSVGLFLGSLSVIVYALAGALVWNYLFRTWEERDLRERFGTQFAHYCCNVPCWLPRITPYTVAPEYDE